MRCLHLYLLGISLTGHCKLRRAKCQLVSKRSFVLLSATIRAYKSLYHLMPFLPNSNLFQTAKMLIYGGTTIPFGSALTTRLYLVDLNTGKFSKVKTVKDRDDFDPHKNTAQEQAAANPPAVAGALGNFVVSMQDLTPS